MQAVVPVGELEARVSVRLSVAFYPRGSVMKIEKLATTEKQFLVSRCRRRDGFVLQFGYKMMMYIEQGVPYTELFGIIVSLMKLVL